VHGSAEGETVAPATTTATATAKMFDGFDGGGASATMLKLARLDRRSFKHTLYHAY